MPYSVGAWLATKEYLGGLANLTNIPLFPINEVLGKLKEHGRRHNSLQTNLGDVQGWLGYGGGLDALSDTP